MSDRGLLDASVFIADESGRPLRLEDLPDESAVSVITVAELRVGVLAAQDTTTRSRRLATLESALRLTPLPVDQQASHHWAELRVLLAAAGRRVNVNDLWIAAVALANDLPVVTQHDDFDVLVEISPLRVIKV